MRLAPPAFDAWQPWRPAELAARPAACAVDWYVLDPAARRCLAEALDLLHPEHGWRRRPIDVPGRYA